MVNFMIEFKNVSKTFPNGTKALKDFNLEIEPGEFVFILGASGAGKSTFLRLIMREEVATQGDVIVNGINLNRIKAKKIPHYRRHLGIVFQDFRLIPTMRVFDNVAFAMRAIGAKEKDVSRRVSYALSLVGLSSKTKSYPNELSGGEQQRVALARALVNDADIIIADEPTGNIDPEMSYEIVGLLDKINKNSGTTIIMVTHEHDLVRRFNNRIVEIKNGTVVSDTKHPEISVNIDEHDADFRSTTMIGYYADQTTTDTFSSLVSSLEEKEKIASVVEEISQESAQQKKENDVIRPSSGDAFKRIAEATPDYSVFFEDPQEGGSDK